MAQNLTVSTSASWRNCPFSALWRPQLSPWQCEDALWVYSDSQTAVQEARSSETKGANPKSVLAGLEGRGRTDSHPDSGPHPRRPGLRPWEGPGPETALVAARGVSP